MKPNLHKLRVPSVPMGLELDPEAGAAYVRYSTEKVQKTLDIGRGQGVFNIDLDAKGGIIGVEIVGFATLNIQTIQRLILRYTAKKVDLSSARISMPEMCPV